MKMYRHGDLVIEQLPTLDGELAQASDIVFAGDSSGHRHRLIGPALMRRDGLVTRMKLDAPAELVHEKSDGHKTITLAAGAYEVRPLRERGDNSDRNVAD